MGFDLGGAMSGVGAGAALGPWGMIGGGLIGGFLGGQDKPDMYSKEDMMATMKPYTDMLSDYKDKALDFMNPNSSANREMKQQLNQQSMDQMGVANMMAQRNDAANPYSGGSGVVSQQAQNNMLKYATQGTNAFQGFMGNQRQSGMNMYNNAIQQTGDLYSSAANLEAANIGTMNQYNQGQQQQMLSGGMSMLGGVGGYMQGKGGMGGLLRGYGMGVGGGPNVGFDESSLQGSGMNMQQYNQLVNQRQSQYANQMQDDDDW